MIIDLDQIYAKHICWIKKKMISFAREPGMSPVDQVLPLSSI